MAASALTIGLTLVGLAVLDWRLALAGLLRRARSSCTPLRWYLPPVDARSTPPSGRRRRRGRSQLLDTDRRGARPCGRFGLPSAHLGRGRRAARRTPVDLALRGHPAATRFFGRLNLAEFVGLAAILLTGFLLVRDGAVTVGAATAAALYFHRLFDPINVAALPARRRPGGRRRAGPPRRRGRPARAAAAAAIAAPRRRRSASSTAVASPTSAGHPVLHDVDLSVPAGRAGRAGRRRAAPARPRWPSWSPACTRPTAARSRIGGVDARDARPGRRRPHGRARHPGGARLRRPARRRPAPGPARRRPTTSCAPRWPRSAPRTGSTALPDGLRHRGRATAGTGSPPTQAQQLALARLVLADPPVAMLDEATAEAGSAGARVLEARRRRRRSPAAPRWSSPTGSPRRRAADRIVVLDAGRVVEPGTHDELRRRRRPLRRALGGLVGPATSSLTGGSLTEGGLTEGGLTEGGYSARTSGRRCREPMGTIIGVPATGSGTTPAAPGRRPRPPALSVTTSAGRALGDDRAACIAIRWWP